MDDQSVPIPNLEESNTPPSMEKGNKKLPKILQNINTKQGLFAKQIKQNERLFDSNNSSKNGKERSGGGGSRRETKAPDGEDGEEAGEGEEEGSESGGQSGEAGDGGDEKQGEEEEGFERGVEGDVTLNHFKKLFEKKIVSIKFDGSAEGSGGASKNKEAKNKRKADENREGDQRIDL